MKIKENESLRNYTTVKIGGIAKKLYFPENIDELRSIFNEKPDEKTYIIGGGSNLLINDKKAFDAVICLRDMDKSISNKGEGKYYIGASVRLGNVIKHINNDGYGGIEYLFSVPALVGGAIVMNAGRGKKHGLCISDYIESVRVYDIYEDKIKDMTRDECEFSYRESIFKKYGLVVVGANFGFDKIDTEEGERRRKARLDLVKKKQDSSGSNFGSVFRACNKYIMYCVKVVALKKSTGVRFSSKTSNWIINQGNGDYKEVNKIINRVIKIHKIIGSNIELEVIKWD